MLATNLSSVNNYLGLIPISSSQSLMKVNKSTLSGIEPASVCLKWNSEFASVCSASLHCVLLMWLSDFRSNRWKMFWSSASLYTIDLEPCSLRCFRASTRNCWGSRAACDTRWWTGLRRDLGFCVREGSSLRRGRLRSSAFECPFLNLFNL